MSEDGARSWFKISQRYWNGNTDEEMIADRFLDEGGFLPEGMSRMPYPCWGTENFPEPISMLRPI